MRNRYAPSADVGYFKVTVNIGLQAGCRFSIGLFYQGYTCKTQGLIISCIQQLACLQYRLLQQERPVVLSPAQ